MQILALKSNQTPMLRTQYSLDKYCWNKSMTTNNRSEQMTWYIAELQIYSFYSMCKDNIASFFSGMFFTILHSHPWAQGKQRCPYVCLLHFRFGCLWWMSSRYSLPLALLLLPLMGFHDLVVWRVLERSILLWSSSLALVCLSLHPTCWSHWQGWWSVPWLGEDLVVLPGWLSSHDIRTSLTFLPCPPSDHRLHSLAPVQRTFHPSPWQFWTQLSSALPRRH